MILKTNCLLSGIVIFQPQNYPFAIIMTDYAVAIIFTVDKLVKILVLFLCSGRSHEFCVKFAWGFITSG